MQNVHPILVRLPIALLPAAAAIASAGTPGSVLAGMSGSTTEQRRLTVCSQAPVPARAATWGSLKAAYR